MMAYLPDYIEYLGQDVDQMRFRVHMQLRLVPGALCALTFPS